MYVITNDKCLEKRFDFCLDFNKTKKGNKKTIVYTKRPKKNTRRTENPQGS